MTFHKPSTLFLDIGGVLLTNGWGADSRQRAAEKFAFNMTEVEERHQECWNTFEIGKMNLEEYLNEVIFYQPQNFSKQDYIAFMFDQSKPLKGAIEYFIELKQNHGFKVIALSNEVRELNEYRIKKFKLNELFDAYISSCYVGLRKPDSRIYKMACDISQTSPANAIFIDDRILNVEVARNLEIPSLHYTGLESAKEYFETVGFKITANE